MAFATITKNSVSASKPSCSHYKKIEHDITSCFQLNRYPDWWAERNRLSTATGRGKNSSRTAGSTAVTGRKRKMTGIGLGLLQMPVASLNTPALVPAWANDVHDLVSPPTTGLSSSNGGAAAGGFPSPTLNKGIPCSTLLILNLTLKNSLVSWSVNGFWTPVILTI